MVHPDPYCSAKIDGIKAQLAITQVCSIYYTNTYSNEIRNDNYERENLNNAWCRLIGFNNYIHAHNFLQPNP